MKGGPMSSTQATKQNSSGKASSSKPSFSIWWIILLLSHWTTAQAIDYVSNGSSGVTLDWHTASSFTPNGTPSASDNVTYSLLNWSGSTHIDVNSPATANVLIMDDQGTGINSHRLTFKADSSLHKVILRRSHPTRNGFIFKIHDNTTVTLNELHDLGTYANKMETRPTSFMKFTGEANITYSQQDGATFNGYASAYDFTTATNVTLNKNPNTLTPTDQSIINTNHNNGDYTWLIGRSDNISQTWTAAEGSSPRLMFYIPAGRQSVGKVGTADVHMSGIDFYYSLKTDGALNRTGKGWHTPKEDLFFQGNLNINSLQIENSPASALTYWHTSGNINIDGQTGAQAGTLSGYALLAEAHAQNLELSFTVGQYVHVPAYVYFTPNAGDLCLNSQGAGLVSMRWCSRGRDDSAYNAALMTVNGIKLLSSKSYITDTNRFTADASLSGAIVEFRGDFHVESQQKDLFRIDSSTLRHIGGATDKTFHSIEAMSNDVGASDPGTTNFAIKNLILGQATNGQTSQVKLELQDLINNHTDNANPEALYIENLSLYAQSSLALNGKKVYIKNSGSWQALTTGTFSGGDGTGTIKQVFLKPTGCLFTLK